MNLVPHNYGWKLPKRFYYIKHFSIGSRVVLLNIIKLSTKNAIGWKLASITYFKTSMEVSATALASIYILDYML